MAIEKMAWERLQHEIMSVRVAVEKIEEETDGVKQSDIPPCHCGGILKMTRNYRQERFYIWCTAEKRSHAWGKTAPEALAAYLASQKPLTDATRPT